MLHIMAHVNRMERLANTYTVVNLATTVLSIRRRNEAQYQCAVPLIRELSRCTFSGIDPAVAAHLKA